MPFSICRGGGEAVDVRSRELATAFGLPYLLTVSRPIQPAKGSSSYVAAAERGIPAVLAEAGGVGQLQEDAVVLLTDGVLRVLAHCGMMQTRAAPAPEPVLLTAFEWVYAQHAGMFYPAVAAGDELQAGQEIGTVRSLFGETLETVTAPAAGRVLFLTINPAVRAGGLLMGIGVL
ncbi:hypothetical protein BH20VER1_BH20VER1_28950 [soil metagenome]